uniref:Uncharacterized protein n=1 Tax=Arundo donax TaxID=35708 RepID=A0A0A9AKZ2_ARUDO
MNTSPLFIRLLLATSANRDREEMGKISVRKISDRRHLSFNFLYYISMVKTLVHWCAHQYTPIYLTMSIEPFS